MKVKALKLFGDGKRLYHEGEVFEQTEEWVDMINSTPHAPLVEVLEAKQKPKANTKKNKKGEADG